MRSAIASVTVLLSLGTVADAAKPTPEIQPVSPSQLHRVGAAHSRQAEATCIPGASGPGVFAVNYLLPPNDAYYTYVRCDACAPNTASVREVHVALHFPVACDQPVVVSFVGARGDMACLEPDTLIELSGPVNFQLSAPAPGDYDFGLTLPEPAHVGGDAFLCLNFTADGGPQCSSLTTRPQLLTTNSCQACRSWNYSVAGVQDLCRVLLPGQPVMYGVFESCPVPVRHRSWGELKLVYR